MFSDRIHVVGLGGTLREKSRSLWALESALEAAREAGATTDLLPLRDLDLPFFEPGLALEDYPPQVAEFLERVERADALLISTAGYHGTLAGVTKNALDLFQLLSDRERPYLSDRWVGAIATAGGDMANVHAVDALVQITHSLRGWAIPLQVAIPYANDQFDAEGNVRPGKWSDRLEKLGRLAVELASSHEIVPA